MQVTTSGILVDFTGIPSWAKRVTVLFAGLSTSGTSGIQIQVGVGSVETSGYLSSGTSTAAGGSTSALSSTSGLLLSGNNAAADVRHGRIVLEQMPSSFPVSWVATSSLVLSSSNTTGAGGGSKTLSGNLDRVRLTTVNGTDTFDAGTINVMWE